MDTPKQKRRKPAVRILRGMTSEQWVAYERSVAAEEHRIHREFMARGLYNMNHRPKLGRPFRNPLITSRAIKTTAEAIV